jgi:hypothetical protein
MRSPHMRSRRMTRRRREGGARAARGW